MYVEMAHSVATSVVVQVNNAQIDGGDHLTSSGDGEKLEVTIRRTDIFYSIGRHLVASPVDNVGV